MEIAALHLLFVIIATVLQLPSHRSEAFSSVRRCTLPRQSSSSSPSQWSSKARFGSTSDSYQSRRPPNAEEASPSHSTTLCRLLLNRRDAIYRTAKSLSASAIVMLVNPSSSSSSYSSTSARDTVYLQGRVTLQPGQSIPTSIETAALYITVRPNVPDDAPRAILDGTRGKSPPVLSARFPIAPSTTAKGDFFPFQFDLTQQNLTPEGALPLPTATVEGKESDGSRMMLWWEKNGKDLIVSARLDTDGVASTRDPEDLVGRGVSTRLLDRANEDDATVAAVSIELRGRGMFGKSVTAKK